MQKYVAVLKELHRARLRCFGGQNYGLTINSNAQGSCAETVRYRGENT